MSLEKLSPMELSEIAADWLCAKRAGEKIEEEVRRRIEGGENVPGCSIGKAGKIAFIPNAVDAYLKLKELLGEKFNPKSWGKYVSISKGDLEKFLEECGADKAVAENVLDFKPKKGNLSLPKIKVS
jgi:hypothetical protein